jgi:hypothetical protein
MFSIYHFWIHLMNHKSSFLSTRKLDDFPFDENMLSCRNKGIFPDLAIKVNQDKTVLTGGELIELKDSDSYTVSSFNSTIPKGRKEIAKLIAPENSSIRKQMEESGDDILSLPVREVFYLVRGRKNNRIKVCLVHGSFFETISSEELIRQSFSQVFEERLKESGANISEQAKNAILSMFSEQESFSKVRNVEKASVKLRFIIMAEVKAEGNILNPKKYPNISDNTLNLVVPCHTGEDQKSATDNMERIIGKSELSRLKIFKIKHEFNGYFLVFQTEL